MARRRLPAAPAPAAADGPRWPPLHLSVFDPADWLAPGEDDGDEARRAAYRAFLDAVAEWDAAHEMPSFEAAAATPDEAFTDDGVVVVDGRRVTRTELAGAQAAYAAKRRSR